MALVARQGGDSDLLAAGQARRDRFKGTFRNRLGTGRVTTTRGVALGNKSSPENFDVGNLAFSPQPASHTYKFRLSEAYESVRKNHRSSVGLRRQSNGSVNDSSFTSASPTPMKNTKGVFVADESFSSSPNSELDVSIAASTAPTPYVAKDKKDTAQMVSPLEKHESTRQPTKSILKSSRRHSDITAEDVADIDLDDDDGILHSSSVPTPQLKRPRKSIGFSPATVPRQPAESKTKTLPAKAAKDSKWLSETKTPSNRSTNQRRKNYGGRTGGLIEEAHDSGLVLELQKQEAAGIRRGQRLRFAPLDAWRNERIIYNRRNSGVGTFLPTANLDKPISSPTRFDDVFERKRFPVRAQSQGKDSLSESSKQKAPNGLQAKRTKTLAAPREDKRARAAPREDKATRPPKRAKPSEQALDMDPVAPYVDETTDKRVPLEPTCEVVDLATNDTVVAVVAKSRDMLSLEPLFACQNGKKASHVPQGGKMLEENDFSNGILMLPPHSVKHFEMAAQTEIFYVASATEHSIDVQIHKSRFAFSQGDSFTIPRGNMYQMKNTSSSNVELYFVLVKDA